MRMPIEKYLLPEEKIIFWSDFNVNYNEEEYRVYITSHRLVLFKEMGVIFKKEEIITENWAQIRGLQYTETGRISKKGLLTFSSSKGESVLEGPRGGMLSLFKAIQRQTLDGAKPWDSDRPM
jgi:hypothetical protein